MPCERKQSLREEPTKRRSVTSKGRLVACLHWVEVLHTAAPRLLDASRLVVIGVLVASAPL